MNLHALQRLLGRPGLRVLVAGTAGQEQQGCSQDPERFQRASLAGWRMHGRFHGTGARETGLPAAGWEQAAAACAGRPSGELQQALTCSPIETIGSSQALPTINPNDFGSQGPAPSSLRLQSFPLRQRVDQHIGRYGQFLRGPLTSPAVQKGSRNNGPEPAHPGRCPPPNLPERRSPKYPIRETSGRPLGGLCGPGTHRPIHRRSIGPFDQ